MSYRREDTSGYAGRLYDELVERFRDDQVFMDVAAIRPGMDFEQALDEALNDCDVMLALIGPAWLSNPHSRRRRRLDDPDDYVRLELEAALGRKITVIPVLVQGARMPAHGQLPPSLAAFARRQAFHLSDHRWHPTPSL